MVSNSVNNIMSGIFAAKNNAKTEKIDITKSYGKTIGEAKLSDEATEYYKELKEKYADMDFILVSKDKIDEVKSNPGRYGISGSMVVLIDEEKIEKMATDESFRKQYETIIDTARKQLPLLQEKLAATGANVKSVGIKVNDNGTASYFAVIDKSLAAQRERIEKRAAEKKAEKREQNKKAEEKRAEERLKEKKAEDSKKEEAVTYTANSIDELVQKISDAMLEDMSNNMFSENEMYVGQTIDFRG